MSCNRQASEIPPEPPLPLPSDDPPELGPPLELPPPPLPGLGEGEVGDGVGVVGVALFATGALSNLTPSQFTKRRATNPHNKARGTRKACGDLLMKLYRQELSGFGDWV